MKFYPVFLDVRDRPCVVVGGGRVAERKALSLFDAGASVTVVSPQLTPGLHELTAKGKIAQRQKSFDDSDLDGAFLAVAATDSQEINTSVARSCRERGILVNVAAPPEESTFIVPSVVERGDLLIAVSTSGVSPALAAAIRQELEKTFGPEYGLFLERLTVLRGRLLREIADEEVRRKIFRAVVDSDVLYLIRAGELHEADRRIAEIAKEAAR